MTLIHKEGHDVAVANFKIVFRRHIYFILGRGVCDLECGFQKM